MDKEDIEEAIEVLEDASAQMLMETGDENYYAEAIAVLRQVLKTEQKTAVSPGKGTGFIDARALGITVLRPALETKQKTAVSPDGGTGFIDGVWHEPGPTAWQCQCGKAYTVTCISSKPSKREWVGLTDEERHNIREWQEIQKELGPVWAPMMLYLYLAIEQALKEKNHG